MTESEAVLRDAVAAFVDGVESGFRLDELARGVSAGLNAKRPPRQDLAKALRESLLTFHQGETDLYIPRRVYFRGARFLVVPLEAEIEAGILLPGHRLMPFYRRDVFPADCEMEIAEGLTVGRRTVTWRVADVISYHSLFGWQNMLEYFAVDDESNAVALAEVDLGREAPLNLTGFDLARWYQDWKLKPGDALRFTVIDWDHGRFRVEPAPREESSVDRAAREKRWRLTLEDALEEVVDESGVLLDVHEQLSLAFFYGGTFLLENPLLSIGRFLAKSRRVRLCHMGSQAILWSADGEPDRNAFPEMDLTRRPAAGVIDSLDSMLRDLRVSLRSSDIESYMRDEIHGGGRSLGNSLQRCLRWRGDLNFHDDRQRLAFSREIEKLWVGVIEEARPDHSDPLGPQRGQALRIMDAKLQWLKKLDAKGVRADEVPGAEFLHLSQLMSSLSSLLEALNSPDAGEMTDAAELGRTLEAMDASSKRLMDSIEARIELIRLAAEQD